MSVKNQLIQTFDCLSTREQQLLLEIALHFLPDDIATPDDLEAIAKADEEYANGESISDADIDWD